jgi:undecaprenyl diphosphate synthase
LIVQGHWAGGQRLIDFVQWCIEDGVEVLTVYAFSTENWNRDPLEVSALMNIFVEHSQRLKNEAQSRNIRVRVLTTSPSKLPANVRSAVEELEAVTSTLTGFQLNICLSYGSREEIAQSCRRIASDLRSGVIADEALIDEQLLSSYLTTSAIPGTIR